MTSFEQMDQAPQTPPRRRAGTFTLGGVLIVTGALMALSLFFPEADFDWALKASPLILISLGAEVLLAARGGARVKYDWAAMVLCFLLTGGALCLYAAAWMLLHVPDWYRYW